MKKTTKTTIFLFLFHFIFWLWFTYITSNGDEWNWKVSTLISFGYAAMMAYSDYRLRKYNHQLYLASGQGESLIKYLTAQGYVENKKKDDTTFFKKPGFKWNPFAYTTVKESAFYTLINGTENIIEKVPEHLERIRQPYSVD